MSSIFRRVFLTYMTVTTVLVILLVLLIGHFIEDYHITQKQKELQLLGKEINNILNTEAFQKNPNQTVKAIDDLAQIGGNKLFIIKNAEDLAKLDNNIKKSHLEEDLSRIMSGETIVRKRQFASYIRADIVFVGMPLQIQDKTKGCILLYSPLKDVKKIVLPLIRIIWFGAGLSLLLAALVIYIISQQLSKPIIQLGLAAEEMASGQYSTPIDIKGQDEIAKLSRSFQEMRERVQVTERMRQELLANISHEMRTPLTSIRGFLQAILDGVVSEPEQRKYLKLSFQEAGRLTKLTADLLDVAKLQTGNLELNKGPVDLTGFLQNQADQFELSCAEREINLETSLAKGITLQLDPDRFAQVIINLLHNALKFTPTGGAIRLASRQADNKTYIEISDTGVGIHPEELPKIFDYFYKVDKSRDARLGGSGIGLYLVRQLVSLHGGSIQVQSQEGKGTTFTIEFPNS